MHRKRVIDGKVKELRLRLYWQLILGGTAFWAQLWVQDSHWRKDGAARKRHRINDMWISYFCFESRRFKSTRPERMANHADPQTHDATQNSVTRGSAKVLKSSLRASQTFSSDGAEESSGSDPPTCTLQRKERLVRVIWLRTSRLPSQLPRKSSRFLVAIHQKARAPEELS